MVFRSKMDVYFLIIMFIAIILFAIVAFFPLLIERYRQVSIFMIISPCLFIIGTSYFLWTYLSVKYVLNQDHLFIKGGINRRRIPYEQIVKVVPTRTILTGHSILSSRDAIELFYEEKGLKSVKISPKEKSEFISELKQRNPNLKVK